jgi:L-asparaginase / beta-aspartyl-peptidase
MKYRDFIRKFSAFCLFFLICLYVSGQSGYSLAIHGGAGVMKREKMSPERQKEYMLHLNNAMMRGDSVLRNGGSSTEAVVATITYLENCPLFNAGKGAVFTWEGKNELDASIMEGTALKAGAVASVRTVKNPIKAAQAVMDHSEHVLLSGKGAEEFARKQNLEMVSNRYFFTKERYTALKSLKKQNRARNSSDNHGTVGCVALDRYGNLCAGTSTGGMNGKRFGRIGDTPLIGAGTWADNRSCAVSCTGHGEYFIRLGIAHDVASQMEYLHIPIEKAAENAIQKLTGLGGTGGLIAVDREGNISMPFNTSGMFRGYIKSTGEKEIAIFASE